MAVQYSDLVLKTINGNPTVFNTKTGQGYATPQQLATDLGISPTAIQWGSIQKNESYQPGMSFGETPQPSQQQTPPANQSPAISTGVDINAKPSWADSALWGQLSPEQKAFFAYSNQIGQNTYSSGQNFIPNQNYNQALQLAQDDPTIKSIYGDQAKMALSNLQNQLGNISAEYAQSQSLITAEQEQARKDLANQYAGMGQAQSGFRKQAEALQKQQQSGVIQSSQRQLQQQVRSLGAQYESQFGSSGLPGISAGGFNYQPVGSITGSQVTSQQQAIQQKAADLTQNVITNPLQK